MGSRPFQKAEGEDEELVAVAEAGEAVLAPAVGLAARVVVGEVVPGVAVGAVVLAHRAPGALADVRPPAPPRGDRGVFLLEALVLFRETDRALVEGDFMPGRPGAGARPWALFLAHAAPNVRKERCRPR